MNHGRSTGHDISPWRVSAMQTMYTSHFSPTAGWFRGRDGWVDCNPQHWVGAQFWA